MAVRQFGNTWWGSAWLNALERRALVDPNRLPRGRTYARQDRVRDLELGPGLLRARVQGQALYRSSLSLRVLSDDEWDLVLDTVMGQARNAAALLAGEVPYAIGDLVLPDRGELGPECSCPDWAEPCKHVAALCYLAADLFDTDPFALLTLRGRSREQVLSEVRTRRSERLGASLAPPSDLPRGSDPGTSAAAAYRRDVADLDRSATVPRRPGAMPELGLEPPLDAGIDVDELRELVADAARRAWAMLAEEGDSGLGLTVGQDVVRRAVHGDTESIASATGVAVDELRAAAIAWELGGTKGFVAHVTDADVSPADLEPGRQALGAGARIRKNTVSIGALQLRLDDEGNWWRFRADDDLGWVLADGPASDPEELIHRLD